MSTEAKKSTAKYWVYFAISMAVMIALLVILPEWFWVVLPFPLTYLVKAFDAI